MNKINDCKTSRGRLIFGIILLLLGFALIANQFDLIPFSLHRIIFTWQSLLILIGILMVTGKESRITGYIVMGIGVFFLIPQVMDVPFEYRRLFWPVMLIFLGFLFIFRTNLFSKKDVISGDDNYINDVNVFGGHDRIINSAAFRGGKVTSVFGGGTYDLRSAKLAPGVNILDLMNVFGGCELIVPSDWDIKVEISAVFGGFSDKRLNLPTLDVKSDKKLIIKGVTILNIWFLRCLYGLRLQIALSITLCFSFLGLYYGSH